MNIHYQDKPLEAFLDAQQQLGYESVSFWAGGSHYCLDHNTAGAWQPLKSALRDRGLQVTCMTTPSFTGEYQFAMSGDGFAKSLAYFCNGLRLASELESPLMTVNSGWGGDAENRRWQTTRPHSSAKGKCEEAESKDEEAWRRSQEMLFRLAEEGKRLGVALAMETLRAEETDLVVKMADLQRYLQELNHPNLKVLLDTAAMASAGETAVRWFAAFRQQIVGLHFVDSTGEDHLAWGDGALPLPGIMETLTGSGFAGVIAFELTASRYLADPIAADRQNLAHLAPWL